jgi:bifunctional enzyme CysN/CysC
VKELFCAGEPQREVHAGMAVTVTLEDEIDVSRGDVLCHPDNRASTASRISATLVWMDEKHLVPGREYWIKHGGHRTPGSVTRIVHRVNVNTLEKHDAPTLGLNEIGAVEIRTSRPLIFDSYEKNRNMGAFIVIDRLTNGTVGAGMITGGGAANWDTPALGRPRHTKSGVTIEEREKRYGQKATTILITGLSGSGKTAVATEVEHRLFEQGRAVMAIDGLTMRQGMNRDLGFAAADRSENLRRSMEVAKLFNDAGLICIASLVAPEDSVRKRAREVVGADKFFLVHLSAPIEWCKKVDESGIYRDADAGKMSNIPGVDFPYEPPSDADLTLPSHELSVGDIAERIIRELERRGRIG